MHLSLKEIKCCAIEAKLSSSLWLLWVYRCCQLVAMHAELQITCWGVSPPKSKLGGWAPQSTKLGGGYSPLAPPVPTPMLSSLHAVLIIWNGCMGVIICGRDRACYKWWSTVYREISAALSFREIYFRESYTCAIKGAAWRLFREI